jgi:hypothetical protein
LVLELAGLWFGTKGREGPLVGSLVGLEEAVRLVSREGLGRREKEVFMMAEGEEVVEE